MVFGNVEIRHDQILLALELAAELFVLALKELVAAKKVNGAMLCRGHQPGARIVRNARLRPALESDDKSVLGEFFRQTDIADDAREARDELGRLDSPDGVDDAMGFGG